MRFDDLHRPSASISSIGTQVLPAPGVRCLALDHDGLQHLVELGDVMLIGPGHDERQRDATAVHQQVALAPFFFPRSVGLGPTACCAKGALNMAPSMLCHRQAMPSICSYSANPAFQTASNTPALSHSRNVCAPH